jgi:hypothetical protein
MIIRQEFSSLRQGLVGAWCPSLGASGLTPIDRSGLGRHASVTGFSSSAITGGLTLSGDGTTAQGAVADYPQARVTQATLSAWIRIPSQGTAIKAFFSSYSQNTAVAGISAGINVANASQNRLSLVVGNNTGTGVANYGLWSCPATVADNILHHVAITVDSTGNVSFFVDGVSSTASRDGGSSVVSPVYAATNYVTIGAERTSGAAIGKFWPGLLDDLRLYSRVLTLSEIRLLASRRGIGLSPLPDRAAGLPRKLFVNDAGTWQNGDAYVNTGSGWRLGVPLVNDAGTWR